MSDFLCSSSITFSRRNLKRTAFTNSRRISCAHCLSYKWRSLFKTTNTIKDRITACILCNGDLFGIVAIIFYACFKRRCLDTCEGTNILIIRCIKSIDAQICHSILKHNYIAVINKHIFRVYFNRNIL